MLLWYDGPVIYLPALVIGIIVLGWVTLSSRRRRLYPGIPVVGADPVSPDYNDASARFAKESKQILREGLDKVVKTAVDICYKFLTDST